MTYFFCCTVLFFSLLSCLGQTKGTARLYGYKQPVVQGIIPGKAVDEEGGEVTAEAKQRFNYLIFLVSSSVVHPSEVWINGSPYSATVSTVSGTPVKHKGQSDSDTAAVLVPKTTQRVIQVHLAPANQSKLTAKGRSLAAGNEMVIIYKSAGKFYHLTKLKLAVLGAAPMQ